MERGGQLHIDVISTRTPHAGSDACFLQYKLHGSISTRTPHAGSDAIFSLYSLSRDNFNPHSPCGE